MLFKDLDHCLWRPINIIPKTWTHPQLPLPPAFAYHRTVRKQRRHLNLLSVYHAPGTVTFAVLYSFLIWSSHNLFYNWGDWDSQKDLALGHNTSIWQNPDSSPHLSHLKSHSCSFQNVYSFRYPLVILPHHYQECLLMPSVPPRILGNSLPW